jgi:ferredoxin
MTMERGFGRPLAGCRGRGGGSGRGRGLCRRAGKGLPGAAMSFPPIPVANPARGSRAVKRRSSRASVQVLADRCTGCGICLNACQEGAIAVDDIAVVDAKRCLGCGTCVAECPNQALLLGDPMAMERREALG